MSDDLTAKVADAQRRALFAAEVIVNRRLHDFSMRYQTHYANDVAEERKAIEKEIGAIRRRVPAPPAVTDDLVALVAGEEHAPESVRAVLLALAAARPDVLATDHAPIDDEDDED
ncbi:hypothetical protein [Azospirillum rugosum]|uniref:Uncharacterized protein (DUF1778 family) n=1 Tax=Azospirillum rugosum TaxID=416170 RepID=A0ABS4SWB0_9PROT|nr:hypothetical protein [Azospirillum rugosum]MBP2296757.1 uncharacterized protein (DUF1778 family) [Azospirillum rugosum]MDQ0530430.1 uncharacterized protein (DUF1778 family) [Azospirillum rugosum]